MGATEEIYSAVISHAHVTKVSNALNTPPVATPPRSATPPPHTTEKRKSERKEEKALRDDRSAGVLNADSIDPNALNKALMKEFEDAGRHREVTPGGSPSRKRQRVYGDR
jgi:cell division cycle 20-like protein 1 (cofactor of APC complex)